MRRRRLLALPAALALTAAAPAPQPVPLPGEHLHPESVSILPDGTAYVGSMTGGVLKVSLKTGKAEQFIQPGAFGSGALFGVFADTRNHLLWTCSNSFPAPGTQVAGAAPGHWAKAFDLATGTGRISLALPGDKPTCNDFAAGKDGSVFIADTGQPHVLRWKPGSAALEIWADDPLFGAGLDGIALGGDGNLYLDNVRDGSLFRVIVKPDGSAGAVAKLTPSQPLANPDGLRHLAGMSFLVAEGAGRVARLTVTGDQVEVANLFENRGNPTGVDSFAGQAWYVEAYLGALFSPGKAPPPPLPFKLTPVALPH